MDDLRVGRVVRALRRRRGWRQQDLGEAAGRSQQAVSLVERGHLRGVSLSGIRAICGALEADAAIDIRWRGGAIDRLLDDRHAAIAGAVAGELMSSGWQAQVEVSYSHFGERGSIDVLGWHEARRALLVIEVKSELTSVEATLRKLDEKLRLGPIVARERFGWEPARVSCLLVLPNVSTERRRVRRSERLLSVALPLRGAAVRRWLREPIGRMSGIRFLSITSASGAKQGSERRRGGPERVRLARAGRSAPRTNGAST